MLAMHTTQSRYGVCYVGPSGMNTAGREVRIQISLILAITLAGDGQNWLFLCYEDGGNTDPGSFVPHFHIRHVRLNLKFLISFTSDSAVILS